MLKIRLQRIGRRNDPAYRVVVGEHTLGPKSGKFVERVGSYNPKTKERILNVDRIQHWLSVGAKASGTVHNMLVSEGVVSGKKVNVLPKKTVPVKEEEPVAEAPAAAEANESTETAETPAAEEGEQPTADASPEAAATEEQPENTEEEKQA